MTVYEAIHQMRQLTAKGQPFALSYMTYSRQSGKSHGPVVCEHALLVKNQKPAAGEAAGTAAPSSAAAPSSSASSAVGCAAAVPQSSQDYMLTYRDQDTGEARRFWQPLLLSFNHQPLNAID